MGCVFTAQSPRQTCSALRLTTDTVWPCFNSHLVAPRSIPVPPMVKTCTLAPSFLLTQPRNARTISASSDSMCIDGLHVTRQDWSRPVTDERVQTQFRQFLP